MPEVLVTGATGFIGRQLVQTLCAQGHRVTAMVREPIRARALLPSEVELEPGDILNPESLARAVARADQVFHLASLLKMPWHQDFGTVNAEGTKNLAAACARRTNPPRLVVVSSLAAAGPSPADDARDESSPASPVSKYGRVKLEAEMAARGFADRLPVTIVRPPMVFGPHDRSALKLYRSTERGLHVVPTRHAHELAMIHVEDLSRALVVLGARGEIVSPSGAPSLGLYYVAHEETPSYAELGPLIAQAMGWPGPRVIHLPFAITWLAALGSELAARVGNRPSILNLDKAKEARAGAWICRAEKIRSQLGFEPEALPARLAATGRWYLDQGWLGRP